jgi:hypothetical protein
MSKIVTLRSVINSALKSIHPRIYYQSAPDDAVYPYLVYDLTNSIDDLSLEQFVLDVNGWDAPTNGDTLPLENLMANVDSALHRKTKVIDDMAVTIYRDNRLSLLDDDPRIRRRQYTYEIRTFGGIN